MHDLNLTEDSPGVWHLAGSMTTFSVSDAQKKLNAARPSSGSWIIDCQAVTRIDSAGIAYFLSCIRFAKRQSIQLSIKNLPQEVVALMEAQGVKALIEQVCA